MISMSSTLVETVSINYEDFNESFLTCGTCLCMYDGSEHTPKLLPCSHTVCLHCLSRIAASQTRDTGTFRCPICRESITIPRGGVSALPPSFLVNQLLDLMARQRREVVPKCSVHLNQELLFCETCDTVFCSLCTSGSHSTATSSSCEHTVIPFSIAIKRMSEILLYKANECISKLSQAEDAVNSEIQRLELATAHCLDGLEATFHEISRSVEKRRSELSSAIAEAKNAKKKVLEEQLSLIQGEKDKVTEECDGLQHQVEVRYITQRISSLGEKLDSASALGEPRENAFLTCDLASDALLRLDSTLATVGRVRTSTTFPSLSTLHVKEACVVHLEAIAVLTTVDYHGNVRTNGGDPITAEVTKVEDCATPIETTIVDREDGSYHIKFRPPTPGRYTLKVSVMDRPVRFSPLEVNVSEHNNPVKVYGSRGCGKDQFLQPVAIAMDNLAGTLYVVDTCNSRLKVLTPDLQFIRHLDCGGLTGRSCTGVAVNEDGGWLAIVNWRSRLVTRLTSLGDTLSAFTHSSFQEPIDVAIDANYGHILVADNGPSCVFVFDTEGKLLFQVGKKGSQKGCFNLISCVTVGPGGEIVVADSRIQVFSAKGDFLQELFPEGKGRGRYGGVAVDSEGMVIASRSEKGRNFVQVFRLSDGTLLSTLDSHDSKLKGRADLQRQMIGI